MRTEEVPDLRQSKPAADEVPLMLGRLPDRDDPEYREFQLYESGQAERDAAAYTQPFDEPWLNVRAAHEPGVGPALAQALATPEIARGVFGRVADLGAGTCWATAELSKLPRVEEVHAVDLSQGFLRRVGTRVVRALDGNLAKVRLVASTYERVPCPDGHFQAAFLIAAIHHSLAPLRVLREARRLLAPEGILVLIEAPSPWIGLHVRRRQSIEITRTSGATEVAYTRAELQYLLEHSGFTAVEWYPVMANPSANPLKRLVRRTLRWAGLEHLLLSTTFVIRASR